MATVSRSVFVAGGYAFGNSPSAGYVFFTTAANQYAIISICDPAANGAIVVGTVTLSNSVGGVPIYVPPSTMVTAGTSEPYNFTYTLFQSD